jgi:hypothetical protein
MKKNGQKVLVFLTILALIFSITVNVSVSNAATVSNTYGDVNGDNSVDGLDFAVFKLYLLDNNRGFPIENAGKYADLNGDGVIDVLDYALLKSFLLGNIERFPAESTSGSVNIPWDWAGIIGTGQSLAVGTEGNPPLTTSQPFNNLKLSLEKVMVPPWDSNNSAFKMIPLVEPVREYGYYYGGAYPGNIFGETPHAAMANQITSLVRAASGKDYISVHTNVGETGQGIDALSKGAAETTYSGRAYAATLFEVNAIKRLATQEGKTYGVGAIIITHGERDAGNTSYESQLHTLWSDYNKDIKAITGQTQSIPMFIVQQNSCGSTGTSASMQTQWRAGVDYPGDMVCVGPNYQRQYAADGVHLTAAGYQQLGEQFAKVYYERVVLGRDWQPLQPAGVQKSGNIITVHFNVPVGPLVWDTTLPQPNQSTLTEWKNGKGFEVYTSTQRITISSVEIAGDSVKITCAGDVPSSGVKVGYAFNGGTKRDGGTCRWGLLRDSDQFKGYNSGKALPNFCVSFEMAVQ